MKQHVFAFLVALVVWMTGNFMASVLAQQQADGISVTPATYSPAPNQKSTIIITEDARCVQADNCWAWYLFSCNGHLPNCNGGCWITGYYPCSSCIESPGETCTQEQVTLNAGLYRSECTSSGGYYCDACVGYYVYQRPYSVTTWRCR